MQIIVMMPDYFISLIMQYAGALNSDQAERYSKSVVSAWYFSIDQKSQRQLALLLPEYLRPARRVFFSFAKAKPAANQDQLFVSRVQLDLSKTSPEESEQVIRGVMKSLKVISSQHQKFAYSRLLTGQKLQKIFIES